MLSAGPSHKRWFSVGGTKEMGTLFRKSTGSTTYEKLFVCPVSYDYCKTSKVTAPCNHPSILINIYAGARTQDVPRTLTNSILARCVNRRQLLVDYSYDGGLLLRQRDACCNTVTLKTRMGCFERSCCSCACKHALKAVRTGSEGTRSVKIGRARAEPHCLVFVRHFHQ